DDKIQIAIQIDIERPHPCIGSMNHRRRQMHLLRNVCEAVDVLLLIESKASVARKNQVGLEVVVQVRPANRITADSCALATGESKLRSADDLKLCLIRP